jgi:lysyl-tRNA synthetase class 2
MPTVNTPGSTTMQKAAYHEKEKSLVIQFRTGKVYRYKEVPARLWKIFLLYIEKAGSAGKFFNEYIRDHFEFDQLEDVAPL